MYLNIFHRFLGLQIAIKIARICIWQKFKIKKRKEIFFSHLRKKFQPNETYNFVIFFSNYAFSMHFSIFFKWYQINEYRIFRAVIVTRLFFTDSSQYLLLPSSTSRWKKKKSDKILLSRPWKKKKIICYKIINSPFLFHREIFSPVYISSLKFHLFRESM